MLHFIPLGEGNQISIEGNCKIIGRGETLGIDDQLLSRQHASISVKDENHVTISAIGLNPIVISRKGEQEFLPTKESTDISIGDIVFFLPPNRHPFILSKNASRISPKRKSSQIEDKENILLDSKEFKTPIARISVKRENELIDLTQEIPLMQNDTPISRKFGTEIKISSIQDFNTRKIAPLDLNFLDELEDSKIPPLLESTLPIMESPGLSPIFSAKPAKKQRLLTEMLSTPLQTKTKMKKERRTFEENSHFSFFLNQIEFGKKIEPIVKSDSINLPDLFEYSSYEFIIMTTYSLDLKWLEKTLPILKSVVNLTIIHGEDSVPQKHLDSFPNAKIYRPNLPISYGVHHGKLYCLASNDILRVAVCTGNLIYKDYKRKTNGIWFQDFQKKKPSSPKTSDFEETLCDYLLNAEVKSVNHIRDYDFSVSSVVLVTSIPGYHTKDKLYKYGHMKLRKILEAETLSSNFEKTEILCQFSSIGSLSENWLKKEFIESFAPDKSETKLKLIWPSLSFVKECIDGIKAGGSLCCQPQNIKPFMEPCFFQFENQRDDRKKVPPHIKTFARISEDKEAAWFCLTSANLSTAAWGQLQVKETQLMIRNYEIGVLFLPSKTNKKLIIDSQHKVTDKEIHFPIPYIIPPPVYETKDKIWSWEYLHYKKE